LVVLGDSKEGYSMTQKGTKRKLAAILSAGVKEYSHLMRDDEGGGGRNERR
jgi:hypothetical protein